MPNTAVSTMPAIASPPSWRGPEVADDGRVGEEVQRLGDQRPECRDREEDDLAVVGATPRGHPHLSTLPIRPRRPGGLPVPPPCDAPPVDGVPALRFASAARTIGAAARAAGLTVPAFRSPPRIRGERRTMRRYPGGAVISVRLHERGLDDVVDDMIDGVIAANGLVGDSAVGVRDALRLAVRPPEIDLTVVDRPATGGTPPKGQPPTLAPLARVAERQTQAA